jgi:Zn-dependent metalloprotease
LNEHLADVFGMLVTLWSENKTSAQSDWLIGEGCLMPGVKGVALRNMKFPGTAYDDSKVQSSYALNEPANNKYQLGKDPQPASWSEIEAYKTKHTSWSTYDHGSVHAFSGVPNRAFVLVAEAFGGFAWEKAGKIWWSAVNSDRVAPTCTFVQFAEATVSVAEEMFEADAAKTVRGCWGEAGVAEGTG